MKVIAVDNYNRENISDFLYLDGLSEDTAKEVANRLNAKAGQDAERFYKAVTEDYQLYKFEP